MSVTLTLPAKPEPYLGSGPLPADFYAFEELLADSEREKLEQVREFFRTDADIILDGCRVPEANRLPQANSFKDTAKILRETRAGVAWEAVGIQFAAYEIALQYAKEREQFGRPIGSFQLVQDLLVKMLGNAVASCGMTVRLAQLQDNGASQATCSAREESVARMGQARFQ